MNLADNTQLEWCAIYLLVVVSYDDLQYHFDQSGRYKAPLLSVPNLVNRDQERDWGRLEYARRRIRTTIVAGESFSQDYLLQLPKRILFPTMAYSVLTHWMLGEALQTQEAVWLEDADGRHVEHSRYNVGQPTQRQILCSDNPRLHTRHIPYGQPHFLAY